ncbi:MAG: molybdopterin-dependent oxidoreductase [Thalassovita sp.]
MLAHIRLTAAALLSACALPALADLATPQGEVILTVSGTITETNADGTAQFDLDMLRALPSDAFETSTIWTNGPQQFKGVPLKALMQELGADGKTLRSIAINAYEVQIPVSDAQDGGPIIAYELNGAAMSVRDKGPLWVVYPYDSDPRFRTEVVYSRSIWQLDRIEIVN